MHLRLLVVIVALCSSARAHGDAMPVDDGSTRLLDEAAERTRRDDLPDDAAEPGRSTDAPPLRFEASLNGAVSAPLAQNPDVAGFGFAVTYGVGWGEIPLAFGIDYVSVGSLGDATAPIELSMRAGTLPAERYVSTRLMHFDAWLRLQPAHYWIRPYAEGFFGAQLFQGRYLVRAGSQQSDVAQSEDWGRNFGWGAGVELVDLLGSTGMSLTLGMRYVYADAVRVSRSLVLANERLQLPYEADTTVLLFMLGIGLHYELADPPRRR